MIDSPGIQETEEVRELEDISNFIEPGQDEVLCQEVSYAHGFKHRFVAMFLMCFLNFGSYFCYDNPAALEGRFMSDLNITITEFGAMNSVYAWPNVFLCFVGGYLTDRVFGVRLGTNIYVAITLFGQLIVASGAMLNMYWLVLFGRFVFGIGGESLAVVQSNYAVRWFKDKELNMVFGLQISVARVGSAVNFMVMESTYKWLTEFYDGCESLGLALFIAASTCLLSNICALILSIFDSHTEKILNRSGIRTTASISLKDVKHFPLTFWLVCIICVMYYVAVYPFISLGTDFFKEKFHIDDVAASRLDGLVYIISVFACPGFGCWIDFTGKNTLWILIAISGTATAHALLAFTTLSPYIGMVLMGVTYSILASSLWPLVSLIIPEYQLGTAYGVCQAVQNLGLAVMYIVTGRIVDKFGYRWLEIFFISCLIIAYIATLFLWVTDKNRGSVLNKTPCDRKIHQKSIQITQSMQGEKLLATGSCANNVNDFIRSYTTSEPTDYTQVAPS